MERPEEQDHERLAEEVNEQVNELDERSDHLEEKVIEVRREWKAKRADPNVPGAPPDDEEDDESQE